MVASKRRLWGETAMSEKGFTLNRRTALGFGLMGVGSILMPGVSTAAQLARNLDVYQGFNFSAKKRTAIGFIRSLSVGQVICQPDISVKDPTNTTASMSAVAVLNHFLWETRANDAIYLAGQISTENKQQLRRWCSGR